MDISVGEYSRATSHSPLDPILPWVKKFRACHVITKLFKRRNCVVCEEVETAG